MIFVAIGFAISRQFKPAVSRQHNSINSIQKWRIFENEAENIFREKSIFGC